MVDLSHQTDELLPVFLYGTLRQGESAEDVIAPDVWKRVPAVARGRLLTIDAPYPAAVFGEPDAPALPGELVWLRKERFAAAIERVDDYENVPFLFRRVKVEVEAEGTTVTAFAYTYTHASHAIKIE